MTDININFHFGGKSFYLYYLNQIIEVPYQKEKEVGDLIVIEKVTKNNEVYGQPFLPIRLIGKVVEKLKIGRRIGGMKYKSKKRKRKKWTHKPKHTEIEIISIEDIESKE